MWAHSPLFGGLAVTSTAAGLCISAGVAPRPFAFVFHAYIVARSFREECAYFVVIRYRYICDSGRRVGPRERPAVRRASIVRIEYPHRRRRALSRGINLLWWLVYSETLHRVRSTSCHRHVFFFRNIFSDNVGCRSNPTCVLYPKAKDSSFFSDKTFGSYFLVKTRP